MHYNVHIQGGPLDFSHRTEVKIIYVTEFYMKKQYKSSIFQNHFFLGGVPLKRYVAS